MRTEEEKSEGGAGMRGILPTPSVSVMAGNSAFASGTKSNCGIKCTYACRGLWSNLLEGKMFLLSDMEKMSKPKIKK